MEAGAGMTGVIRTSSRLLGEEALPTDPHSASWDSVEERSGTDAH